MPYFLLILLFLVCIFILRIIIRGTYGSSFFISAYTGRFLWLTDILIIAGGILSQMAQFLYERCGVSFVISLTAGFTAAAIVFFILYNLYYKSVKAGNILRIPFGIADGAAVAWLTLKLLSKTYTDISLLYRILIYIFWIIVITIFLYRADYCDRTYIRRPQKKEEDQNKDNKGLY